MNRLEGPKVREFDPIDVLAVAIGRPVCPCFKCHVDRVHVMEHMVGGLVYSPNQFAVADPACAAEVLRQHPDLEDWKYSVPDEDQDHLIGRFIASFREVFDQGTKWPLRAFPTGGITLPGPEFDTAAHKHRYLAAKAVFEEDPEWWITGSELPGPDLPREVHMVIAPDLPTGLRMMTDVIREAIEGGRSVGGIVRIGGKGDEGEAS